MKRSNENIRRLLIANKNNDYETFNDILLNNDINVRAINNNQLLKDASSRGNLEIVKILLRHGADAREEAINLARRNNHISIVKLLSSDFSKYQSEYHFEFHELLMSYNIESLKSLLFFCFDNDNVINVLLLLEIITGIYCQDFEFRVNIIETILEGSMNEDELLEIIIFNELEKQYQ